MQSSKTRAARDRHLHGNGNLMGSLVGGAEQPPGGLPLLAKQAYSLWHRHVLEAGVEDGAAHKLLLALASVALSLQQPALLSYISSC